MLQTNFLTKLNILLYLKFAASFHEQFKTIFQEEELMGLSIAISKNYEIIYQGAFGYAEYDSKRLMTSDMMMKVASISKIITAISVMTFVDQGSCFFFQWKGRISLDDDISQYLHFPIRNIYFQDIPITIRQLLSHTSSLIEPGDEWGAFIQDSFANLQPPLSSFFVPSNKYYSTDTFLPHAPGTYFCYSQIGYLILGTLVEKLSQMRFDIFTKERIFNLIGVNTTFNIDSIEDFSNLATIYGEADKSWIEYYDNYHGKKPKERDLSNYKVGVNAIIFSPGGALRSSAIDLVKIINYLFQMKLVDVSQMIQEQWGFNGHNGEPLFDLFRHYGLGMHIVTGEKGYDFIFKNQQMYGHIGADAGLRSDLYFGNGIAIAISINGSKKKYKEGKYSSFLLVEERIFKVIGDHLVPE